MRTLKDNCTWDLTWNGEKIDLGMGLDDQLDSFLINHLKDFNINKGATFYSKQTPLEESQDKIEQIRSDVDSVKVPFKPSKSSFQKETLLAEEEDPDDIERFFIPNSIGVNKGIESLLIDGVRPLVTGFNTEKWKDNKIARLRAGDKIKAPNGNDLNSYLTNNSPEDLINKEMDAWPILTEYGNSIHSIFEDIFNDKEPSNKGLPDTVYNSVVSQVREFRRSIESQYPGCKFYPEFVVKSKWDTLSPDLQAALTNAKADSLNGVIDLLVIDKNGVGHIYDYKVSRKDVSPNGESNQEYWGVSLNTETQAKNLWGSAKKLKAGYQVEFYRQICAQYGLIVKDCRIVPIKLNLKYDDPTDPFKITEVEGVKIASNSQIIFDPAGMKKSKISYLFAKETTQSVEDIEKISQIYDTFFGSNEISDSRNIDEKVNYYKQKNKYVRKLSPSDRQYKLGEREYEISPLVGGKTMYCTANNLDTTLRDLIVARNDTQSLKYIDFVNTLQSVLNGEDKEVLLRTVGKNQRNFVERIFSKYINNGWVISSDENAHSIGIIVLRKGNRSEVICLSTTNPRNNVSLGKGTSILGKTKTDKGIDQRKTLPSMAGNLALMKAMVYVSQTDKTEFFSKFPISSMKVISPWVGVEHSVSNSELISNYNSLILEYPTSGALKSKSQTFMNDLEAIVEEAEELIEGLNLRDGEENYLSAEWFQKKIDWFTVRYSSLLNLSSGYQYTPEYEVLSRLKEGLLMSRGFSSHIESDKGDWTNQHFYELDGLMIASPQYSSSSNIRELGQAIDEYAKEVRKQIYTIGMPIQGAFQKVYEKYGVGAKVFDTWFADKEKLILKDPNSAEFNGDPVTREALDIFLKTMCRLRHPDYNEEQIENAKQDEDYYAIPLLEAKFSRQVKGAGFIKALKNKWRENLTVTQGLFMGNDDNIGGYDSISDYVSANQEIYNKLKYDNMLDRQARLLKYGAGMCETDLEIVMNAMLFSFCRSNVSKQYIPIIAGLKVSLDRADALGGTSDVNMKNIRKRFDDIVKTKFYGESIVPEGFKPLLSFLNIIKSGFTTLTLSLNSRSFLRESLQGIYTGISRARVKMFPGITEKSYIEGLTYVIQEAHKNFSSVSLLQQLNAIYGMANQSLSQIANQRRLNWAHINHWGKDTLFITATSPDFMHRMSLLVAKMKADGCFDAHSLNENGELVYDIKKDKRFEHLVKGETSHENYLKEKALYISMVEDFNKAGFRNSEGKEFDPNIVENLPQAYTRTEGQSIKNYADLLYGHYDDESKSLLYDTFVGSIFLQYKTYLTSKLEQWTMHEGKYNIATLEQQYDENGNEMYVKFYEDENGAPHKDVILKGEYENLSEEEKKRCRLYFDYNSLPLQGMLQESLKMYKKILTLDTEGIKELWKDPTTRAMFRLQLHDLWLMAFLTALVNFIFGSSEGVDNPLNATEVYNAVKKAGPVESFAYNVITGSMSDSQLGNILGSFTDKPPMIAALNRFAKSSMKVITGDATVAWWLTKNIGAISDFQGMAEVYNNMK